MFMVYWSSLVEDMMVPNSQSFGTNQMGDAMRFMESKRKEGAMFVTFCSENPDCVTRPGVDSVVNGKTPDGQVYDWSKKHRGDGPLNEG
jgi:hypothetical protein